MFICFLAGIIPTLTATDSVNLIIEPACEKQFQEKGPSQIVPHSGEVLVIGQFQKSSFVIHDINQLTVLGPDGNQIPLTFNTSKNVVEFGKNIVAVQFAFAIKESSLTAGENHRLTWGNDIKANNQKVAKMTFDPSKKNLYRQFRWKAPTAPVQSFASIAVIADQNANYYSLWYLLPMTLVFALLTLRKIRARRSSHPLAS